ncbi:MAG: pantetheine-phosphate adenylyltransferase [Patescibacteria group bacterium]
MGNELAICPGSFDPVTLGHLDIIERMAAIFSRAIVAVLDNPAKAPLFSTLERCTLLRKATSHLANVEVKHFDGLLVEFARAEGARVIVRGLRALADFEAEFQMALTNKHLAPEIETVFMVTRPEFSFLSSSGVKEIVRFGGNVTGLVTPAVEEALLAKRDLL